MKQTYRFRAGFRYTFGFNERSIMSACETILSAYFLAPYKPYPAFYLPKGASKGLGKAWAEVLSKGISRRKEMGT